MGLVVNPDQQVSDYVRTALESGMAIPAVFTVEGELGRPNISVTAPTFNRNTILTWLLVGLVIWFVFFRKRR